MQVTGLKYTLGGSKIICEKLYFDQLLDFLMLLLLFLHSLLVRHI